MWSQRYAPSAQRCIGGAAQTTHHLRTVFRRPAHSWLSRRTRSSGIAFKTRTHTNMSGWASRETKRERLLSTSSAATPSLPRLRCSKLISVPPCRQLQHHKAKPSTPPLKSEDKRRKKALAPMGICPLLPRNTARGTREVYVGACGCTYICIYTQMCVCACGPSAAQRDPPPQRACLPPRESASQKRVFRQKRVQILRMTHTHTHTPTHTHTHTRTPLQQRGKEDGGEDEVRRVGTRSTRWKREEGKGEHT